MTPSVLASSKTGSDGPADRVGGAGAGVGRRSSQANRRPVAGWLGLLMVMGFWAVPNNEAAWWHDRIYDGCMLMLDDDRDWECETRLPAVGE